MNAKYPAVAERALYRCEYCHAPESVFNFPFEVEHIHPQAQDGADDLNNLALSCHACNLFKSDFETGRDEEDQAEIALFHPRRDTWDQHLNLEPVNDPQPNSDWKMEIEVGSGPKAQLVELDIPQFLSVNDSLNSPLFLAENRLVFYQDRLFIPERKPKNASESEEIILRAKKFVMTNKLSL